MPGSDRLPRQIPIVLLKKFLLVAVALAWIAAAMFWASPGFFSLDEAVYAAMIERFAVDGALTIVNGYAEFPSKSLEILALVPGPHGLASQYPSGSAILAAPFFLIGGLRGVIVLNALAATGVLWVTYRLALKMTGADRSLALDAALLLGLGSFLVAYAVGIWFHSVALLLAVAPALLLIGRTGAPEERARPVVLAGFVLGLAILIRVDATVAAGAYIAFMLFLCERPYRDAALFVAGLAPGLAASAALNAAKFGALAPLSYGHGILSGEYVAMIPVAVVLAAAIACVGLAPVRAFVARRPIAVLGAVVLALAAFSLASGLPRRLVQGIYVLLIDMQAFDRDLGVQGARLPGGLVLWGGMFKKALFESLPYAGFLAIPLYALIAKAPREPLHVLGFLMIGAYVAFFAPLQWHGGQPPNMRYFLPALPFVAILAASAWRDIAHGGAHAGGARPERAISTPRAAIGLAVAVGAVAAVAHIPTSTVSVVLALGIARGVFVLSLALAVALLAWPRRTRRIRPLAIVVFAYGALMAAVMGHRHDLALMEARRAHALEHNELNASLPTAALVITSWPHYFQRILRAPEGAVAIHLPGHGDFDYRLIDHALGRGLPVYAAYHAAQDLRRDPAAAIYAFEPVGNAAPDVFRVTDRRKSAGAPESR